MQWHWDKKVKTISENAENKAPEPAETSITGEHEIGEITAVPINDELEKEVAKDLDVKESALENQTSASLPFKSVPVKVQEVTQKAGKILHQEKMRKSPPPMDVELAVNIGLLILFLALAILFVVLALHVSAGALLYVYWGLAALCFVIFVTQVIDVILW